MIIKNILNILHESDLICERQCENCDENLESVQGEQNMTEEPVPTSRLRLDHCKSQTCSLGLHHVLVVKVGEML